MRILFLGPCRKQNRQTGTAHSPFDPSTPSGKYVELVQKALQSVAFEFCLSNVIDRPYVCSISGNESNPAIRNLLDEWSQFERRLKKMDVDFVVAFGSIVREAFAHTDQTKYTSGGIYRRGKQKIIFAPHPSFVMVYRRKRMKEYIASLSRQILEHAPLGQNL